MAAKLAKYIDNGWLLMEGSLSGDIGQYDCPIKIDLFGPPLSSPLSEEVRERMTTDRLPTQDISRFERDQKKMQQTVERKRAANSQFTASQAPGLGSQEQTMEDIIGGSERFNPRDVSRAAEQFGTSEDDLAAMVKAKQPTRLSTTMLPYQLQALAWMLDKENPKVPAKGSKDFVQLWRRHERYPNAFTNIATNFSIKDKEPVLASGGILADDMGLGKTLEMISLLVSDLEDFIPSQKGELSATLIVAPLSVMSNWSDQVSEPRALQFCSYNADILRLQGMYVRISLYVYTPTMELEGSRWDPRTFHSTMSSSLLTRHLQAIGLRVENCPSRKDCIRSTGDASSLTKVTTFETQPVKVPALLLLCLHARAGYLRARLSSTLSRISTPCSASSELLEA